MGLQKYVRALCATIAVAAIIFAATGAMAGSPVKLVADVWPPYQIETRSGVSGLSTEIVTSVYKRLGVAELDIQTYPWKRAMAMAQFGEADALFSANYTKERTISLFYPDEPIIESPWVIWTSKETPISSLEDLKGRTIGVVLGYSYTHEFWKFIQDNCDVEHVSNDEINFKKLKMGRLDAIAAEYGNGLHLMKKLNARNIRPHPRVQIKRDGLYIVFSKIRTSEEFVKEFSEELKRFKLTDEYAAILHKYFDLK